jgi:hypothetical protein
VPSPDTVISLLRDMLRLVNSEALNLDPSTSARQILNGLKSLRLRLQAYKAEPLVFQFHTLLLTPLHPRDRFRDLVW